MTYKDKIRFLKSYRIAKENAYALAIQISELEQMQLPNGVHYSDIPKRPNYDDKMAKFGAEYWELTKKQEQAQERMLRIMAVINQIAETDPDGHRILTEYYIKCTPRYLIQENMGISRETRRRWHNRAIEEIEM